MLRFQDVMARFLDTQRSVMLGFLAAGTTATAQANGPTAYPLNGNGHGLPLPAPPLANRLVVPEPAARMAPPPAPSTNGHTAPPPAPTTLPPEANGKHEAQAAVKPASGLPNRETLQTRLLDLLSERTGYPKEALSIDLDLEADLGVDSIKRVEILGTLAESLGEGTDGKPPNLE